MYHLHVNVGFLMLSLITPIFKLPLTQQWATFLSQFPDCTSKAVESVLSYLELTTIRIPSIISRPLKGPIEEVTQPWEVEFVRSHGLENGDFSAHAKLLEIMKVADFLVVDSLKDLCCAYVASTVLSCTTQDELMAKLGMARPATENELSEVYEMYPFLRGSE